MGGRGEQLTHEASLLEAECKVSWGGRRRVFGHQNISLCGSFFRVLVVVVVGVLEGQLEGRRGREGRMENG